MILNSQTNKKTLSRTAFLFVLFIATSAYAFPLIHSNEDDTQAHKLVERIFRSTTIIHRYYYDPGRIKPRKMLEQGFDALSRKIPDLLVLFPQKTSSTFVLSVGNKSKSVNFTPPAQLKDIMKPVMAAFTFIEKNYQGEIKPEEREYAFIGGMLQALDPHSNLLTPKVFKEFKTQTQGEYGGIGIVIGIKDQLLSVVAPFEGPAMKKGLQANDKILEIDHHPTINMPLSEAVELLRGRVGIPVTLTLRRKNREPWEVTIVREKIQIVSVRSKLVEKKGKKFGVLAVRSFQEDTFHDLEEALDKMVKGNSALNGIILDLRNNAGGLLEQSIDMADKFLDSGNVLFTVGANNSDEKVTRAHVGNDLLGIPMIVLVNQGSASASEIVAGALKNNNRAVVMGNQTFGKGSVQSLFSLRDGASIKLTIAQYLTPGKISIQAVGITPDVYLTKAWVLKDEYDIWDDKHAGEKMLEDHLINTRYVKEVKPTFKLQYAEKEKKEEESSYTVKINPKDDYLLNLAIQLLSQTKGTTRHELITHMESFINNEDKKQKQAIVDALKLNGIDWSLPLSPIIKRPELHFISQFVDPKTKAAVKNISAESEVEWQLTVTNKGSVDVHQLLGVIDAKNPLLNQREFVFGKVEAAKTKTAKILIKIPADLVSMDEKIAINFHSESKFPIKDFALDTHFESKPKPHLAYSFEIKDNGESNSQGNGNGLIEKGETIALIVHLQNKSDHPADELTLNIRNLEKEGIFLRKGRVSLGLVPGQKKKIAPFLFEINKDFSKQEVKLEITAIDLKSRARLTDTLSFSVGVPIQKNDPLPLQLQESPLIQITKKTVLPQNDSISISGIVADDKRLIDVTIFAGARKVFYKAASKNSKELKFSTQIPLKEGMNLISIRARDDRKLMSYEAFSIILPQATEVAARPTPPANVP